jgi:conjugative transfer signal peptidase TraF
MARRPSRRAIAIAIVAGIALLGGTIASQPAPRLVWNVTASVPVGLYRVRPGVPISVGDMVIARVPWPYRRLAAARHYIPANVPLVKQVAAGAGDQICALGHDLFRNGVWLATRRQRDSVGRSLPAWQGCVRLRAGQYFLLMAAAPLSFDGRYFGISKRGDIIGKARLLWAR